MQTKRTRVTVADVAMAAGVSPTTVSYVLNDTPSQSIPADTRQRVHDAANLLGYRRSAAARALSMGRSDVVIFALPDIPIGAVVAGIVDCLTEELDRRGLTLLLRQVLPGHSISALCLELSPAAVITLMQLPLADRTELREARIDVINLVIETDRTDELSLLWPNGAIGRLQAEHLISRGHTQLGYVTPADARLAGIAEVRFSGVAEACRDAGLPQPILIATDATIESAASGIEELRKSQVTAICAYNDDVAFPLLAALRGPMAGGRMAIIGVDNVPAAQFSYPPLSTISHDTGEIGTQLAELVTRTLQARSRTPGRKTASTTPQPGSGSSHEAQHSPLTFHLVARQSS